MFNSYPFLIEDERPPHFIVFQDSLQADVFNNINSKVKEPQKRLT